MYNYELGSDAKTVKMAQDLFAKVVAAMEQNDQAEADRVLAIGLKAVNRPFRAEFTALVDAYNA